VGYDVAPAVPQALDIVSAPGIVTVRVGHVVRVLQLVRYLRRHDPHYMILEGTALDIFLKIVIINDDATPDFLGLQGDAVLLPLLLVFALIEAVTRVKHLSFAESHRTDILGRFFHLHGPGEVLHDRLVDNVVDE